MKLWFLINGILAANSLVLSKNIIKKIRNYELKGTHLPKY